MNIEEYNSFMTAYRQILNEENELDALDNSMQLDTVYSLRAILESKTGWELNELILNENSYTFDFICNGATLNYDSNLSLEYMDIMNIQCKVSKNVDTDLCNVIVVDHVDDKDKDTIRRISQFVAICNDAPQKIFNNIKRNTNIL